MESINIVWFTNDLRTKDHAPLYYAQQAGLPVLLLYCFDPNLLQHSTYSNRHGWFVYHSLADLQQQFAPFGHTLHTPHIDIATALAIIQAKYRIHSVFLHTHNHMQHVRQQHEAAQAFCVQNNIQWQAFPQIGVFEDVETKEDWELKLKANLRQPCLTANLAQILPLNLPDAIKSAFAANPLPKDFKKGGKEFKPDVNVQQPGPTNAEQLLQTFLQVNASGYRKQRKQAMISAASGSRLSAHLSFGNISVRQIHQEIKKFKPASAFPNELTAFTLALKQRCFMLQQFTMYPQLASENLNYAVNGIRIKWNQALFEVFTKAKTGFPLVDAAVLCLVKTGYLNYRLRALLISFVTHYLWLDWRKAAPWFAQHMTDFEPGIFYGHVQNIAGCTGLQPIPIINPAKEARLTDKQGSFIKKWLPQFEQVPGILCGNPSAMTPLEQKMYHCEVGKDYCLPMVNPTNAALFAQNQLDRIYGTPMAKKETARLAQLFWTLPPDTSS